MATAVKEVLVQLVQEELWVGTEEAREKFDQIVSGRFATDIFE